MPALGRALHDRNSAVALKAIKSAQEIVGNTNLFSSNDASPLIDALSYTDRQVRFEAAFALAQALPQKTFAGAERVPSILGEALAQTGKPGVLVVASTDRLNQLREQLKNYNVQGGQNADAALAAANSLPAVDVVILSEGDPELERTLIGMRGNNRLERSAKLILVKASVVASPYAALAQNDQSVTLTDAKDEQTLSAAIEEARKRSGNLPVDEKAAGAYALRAAELLRQLAMTRTGAFDLTPSQPTLLTALDDARPEVAKAAGNALAYYPSREAQNALANKSVDEKTPDEMKVGFLKNVSTNAKVSGNQLEGGAIESLQKLAESAGNQDVKSGAAEALGALNLKSEQATTLILNQVAK